MTTSIVDLPALCQSLPLAFCPRCGEDSLRPAVGKSVQCDACNFIYFHNIAAAVGTVIRCGDEVLFVERGLEPSRGLLDIPGGFVDYGESLEQAAIRETHEEVGLELDRVEYLASFPNVYRYRDVVYQTCDVYFQVQLDTRPVVVAADDAAACYWLRPCDVAPHQAAFESVRSLLRMLRGHG